MFLGRGSSSSRQPFVRPAREADADECGKVLFESFQALYSPLGLKGSFASPLSAARMARELLRHPRIYSVVVESRGGGAGGAVRGVNFLDERSEVRGVGPLAVDRREQRAGLGRKLMEDVLARAADARGVRLMQDAFNPVSLAVYARLGFVVREPIALVRGWPRARPPRGALEPPSSGVCHSERGLVRFLGPSDERACALLYAEAQGFDRSVEISERLAGTAPSVGLFRPTLGVGLELAAFLLSPSVSFSTFGVGRTTEDVIDLLECGALLFESHGFGPARVDLGERGMRDGSASPGFAFLVPLRESDASSGGGGESRLFRYCLETGFRIVKVMNLMSLGFYAGTRHVVLPSILF